MGMSIEECIKRIGDIRRNYDRWSGLGLTSNESEAFKTIIDTMRKYQLMQADYEARLRADIVAMLTEIQLEIEEHKMTSGVTNQGAWNECIACCSRVVQQKINALQESEDKEQEDDNT